MVTLILMILGMLLMLIYALWRPNPPIRPHLGWLGLGIVVLAWILVNGAALMRG
jgi:hypothetical protein